MRQKITKKRKNRRKKNKSNTKKNKTRRFRSGGGFMHNLFNSSSKSTPVGEMHVVAKSNVATTPNNSTNVNNATVSSVVTANIVNTTDTKDAAGITAAVTNGLTKVGNALPQVLSAVGVVGAVTVTVNPITGPAVIATLVVIGIAASAYQKNSILNESISDLRKIIIKFYALLELMEYVIKEFKTVLNSPNLQNINISNINNMLGFDAEIQNEFVRKLEEIIILIFKNVTDQDFDKAQTAISEKAGAGNNNDTDPKNINDNNNAKKTLNINELFKDIKASRDSFIIKLFGKITRGVNRTVNSDFLRMRLIENATIINGYFIILYAQYQEILNIIMTTMYNAKIPLLYFNTMKKIQSSGPYKAFIKPDMTPFVKYAIDNNNNAEP